MGEPIELRIQSVWLDASDDVFHVVVRPNSHMEVDDAVASVEAACRLADGKRRPCLVDMRGLTGMSRAARTYYAGPEPGRVHTAVALVVGSPLNRAIGNFFLGLNRPLIPTRMFDTPAAAREWLRGIGR
jgi:hypothetical protein